MSYQRLKELRYSLSQKANKTLEEKELLEELNSLKILDIELNSLQLSNSVCPTCGQKLN